MPGIELQEFFDGGARRGAVGTSVSPAIWPDGYGLEAAQGYGAEAAEAPLAQAGRGTLSLGFTPDDPAMTGPQTVLSREGAVGAQGRFRVEVWPDGSVQVMHEMDGGFVRSSTGPGFHLPGDRIELSYSWDPGGGGWLSVRNVSSGQSYDTEVADFLTLDIAEGTQPWVLGAGAPMADGSAAPQQAFRGRLASFALSDTVENVPALRSAPRGDAEGQGHDGPATPCETPITLAVLADDDDPDGATLAATSVRQVTHGVAEVNADGTVTFTPDRGFCGLARVEYMIADGQGGHDLVRIAILVGAPQPGAALAAPMIARSGDAAGDALAALPTSPEPAAPRLRPAEAGAVSPCFTRGTLIATPQGEMPVESLRPGDRVVTRDNGIQEVRWVGQNPITGADLRLHSHLQPVRIKAHALGRGLPERDMLVSPNHRILVAGDRTQLQFDEPEVLVAAKHLVTTEGIHPVASIGITYIHFLCDRHEVVLSNGAWTESFQPTDHALKGLGNAQRNEIFELFPDLRAAAGPKSWPAARRVLQRREVKLLKS